MSALKYLITWLRENIWHSDIPLTRRSLVLRRDLDGDETVSCKVLSGLVCQVKHEVLMEVCLNSVAVFLTSSAQAAGRSRSDWCHSIHTRWQSYTVAADWHLQALPSENTPLAPCALQKRLVTAVYRNLYHLGQRFSNFFQVGTTFISQNVLRTTLLLGLSNSLGLP